LLILQAIRQLTILKGGAMDHHIRLQGMYQAETGREPYTRDIFDNLIIEEVTSGYVRWLEDRAAIQCGMIAEQPATPVCQNAADAKVGDK
jgi:hypothetical protein